MMREAILNFAKQFKFRPKVEGGKLKKFKKFIVAGMGGSHLAGGIVKTLKPELDIVIHNDYELPPQFDLSRPSGTLPTPGEGKVRGKTLVIASSYSGNTEETISAFELAIKNNLPVIAIATGGKLLELAKQHKIPYIELPNTGIQPRSALGFSLLAFLKVMKQSDLLKEAKRLSQILRPSDLEQTGKELAAKLKGFVPVIYSSARNMSVPYNWKIKFNETGKIPAFYNVFPELNHNEMTGFDVKDTSRGLSEKFYFIILRDSEDHPQVQKRMVVLEKLYRDRKLPVEIIELSGATKLEKIFSSLLLADWVAVHTAQNYGLETEAVPVVEEFKKLIA